VRPRGSAWDDDPFQIPNYPDMIVIPFRIPWASASAARVDGRPGLAVSGLSDGALTLWRRGGEAAPPQELATFAADLDGSLWAADGKFLGWLLAGDRALLDPDWLRGIGASTASSLGIHKDATAAAAGESRIAEASGKLGSLRSEEDSPSVVPVAWTSDFDYACKELGLDRRRASRVLHELKEDNSLGGDDNVLIHIPSRDVYYGEECIGNLHD